MLLSLIRLNLCPKGFVIGADFAVNIVVILNFGKGAFVGVEDFVLIVAVILVVNNCGVGRSITEIFGICG